PHTPRQPGAPNRDPRSNNPESTSDGWRRGARACAGSAHATAIDRDKQAAFAALARAEVVSLPRARRLRYAVRQEQTPASPAGCGRGKTTSSPRVPVDDAVARERQEPVPAGVAEQDVGDAVVDQRVAVEEVVAVEPVPAAAAVGEVGDARPQRAVRRPLRPQPAPGP